MGTGPVVPGGMGNLIGGGVRNVIAGSWPDNIRRTVPWPAPTVQPSTSIGAPGDDTFRFEVTDSGSLGAGAPFVSSHEVALPSAGTWIIESNVQFDFSIPLFPALADLGWPSMGWLWIDPSADNPPATASWILEDSGLAGPTCYLAKTAVFKGDTVPIMVEAYQGYRSSGSETVDITVRHKATWLRSL